ncbi:metal-dependent transcriptional regulator [Actinotalea sp. K2]|uniref:metal-dependent transcriptional regulator n=1 Tax=Actinotalea sp. K2 TaxID=2939438 RepID=UPI002017DB07|nr:metal-dependent transcriptional regulator [Actinotalea sp. K2]MCL3860574.1 metal-dependent transcriptional regulator [Actinotalea sp. K2]
MSSAPRAEPSRAGQDCLKAIWSAQEWTSAPVATSQVAERLGVGAPTVSETVQRLVGQGLVEHRRYGPVTLTPAGRVVALRMVRRHRLIETWLVEHLGYGWDEVHDEAEVLEHAVSDLFVERLDALLGRPVRDPHGDPVPSADGQVVLPDAVPLAGLAPGQRGTVARVSDADPAVLRECRAAGIGLDVVVTAPTDLSLAAQQAVRVVPQD